MLYKRYGKPTDLIQQMLDTGQFSDFIDEVVTIRNEEVNEQTMWEYYLHRVFDMPFDEFLKKVKSEDTEPVDMNEIETTVKASQDVLKLFGA